MASLDIEVASKQRICHMSTAKKCKGIIKPNEKCLTFRGYRVTENYCRKCMKELIKKL